MSFREPQTPGIAGLNELTSAEETTVQSISALGDPGADRLLFWDESANDWAFLTAGSGLTITGTSIAADGSSGASTALDNLASVAINAALVLGTSDAFALGSATKMWSDLFLADGAVINFNNGDVTITHSTNVLAFAGGTYTFDGAIGPSANDGAALGSATVAWADLFLASGGVINFGNGEVTLTSAANLLTLAGGQFTFGANTAYFTETDNGNSGAADTINWTTSNKQKSTLTDNVTLTFTAPGGPCSLVLKLVQDATGSRTVTWPASVEWPGGTAPTLTTTASRVDIITFYYDGTTYFGSSSLNYSP